MNFYQVNQRTTFEREFTRGYLCSPSGDWGGWPLMKKLQTGDILFHYCSVARGPSGRGAVLGISRIIDIGKHKGIASQNVAAILGTQCIRYTGRHLSEQDFEPTLREHYNSRYPDCLEVHTAPLRRLNLRKLSDATPQAYLFQVRDEVAERFLQENGIQLEESRSAARQG